MISKSESALLVNYALENEEHLEVAIKTHFVFDSIRETIIEDFISSLVTSLKTELGENWEIANEMKGKVFDQYTGLMFSKKNWKNYFVRLQQEKSGAREFCLGVVKANEKLPPIPDLKKLLDDEYKPGKAYPWWVWFSFLEEPYTNWNNLDILLALYRKTEAIEYLKRHILKIIKISEPLLDKIT